MNPTVLPAALAVLLAVAVQMPGAAWAQRPKPSRPPVKTEAPDKAAERTPARKSAARPKFVGDSGLVALLEALHKALEASRRAGEDPDLTTTLLAGIAEVSLVSVIHGHYALAGVGQAMRAGGMSSGDVKVVAADMERNFGMLADNYQRLSVQKAFHPQLVDIFRTLQILATKARETAGALGTWAAMSADQGRASAFEAALEDYRGRVKALVAGLRPPEK